MKGKQLERGLKKSILITSILSVIGIIGTIIVAPYLIALIKIITSYDYTQSIILLRILSIILFTDPLIGIYTSYYTSIGKTGKVAISVIISTIANIVLNLFLIWKFLPLGMNMALVGVSIATVTSRLIYLGILWAWKERSP